MTSGQQRLVTVEPASWLRSALSARLNEVAQFANKQRMSPGSTIVAGIRDGSTTLAEDRTCDRCRVDVPKGTDFYPGMYPHTMLRTDGATMSVNIIYGLCSTCVETDTSTVEGATQ